MCDISCSSGEHGVTMAVKNRAALFWLSITNISEEKSLRSHTFSVNPIKVSLKFTNIYEV